MPAPGPALAVQNNQALLDAPLADFAADRLTGGGKTGWFLDFLGDVRTANQATKKARST